jgi:prevent-host-death family protein
MSEVTITEARGSLSALVDQAHEAPVFLTRRNRAVAAIVDADQLERLRADAEELADIRAVDDAWQEAERLKETPIPWDDVKRDLGLL